MQLEEFIATTLAQIQAGVQRARNNESGVCPRLNTWNTRAANHIGVDIANRPVFLIEFDVAVVPHETGGVGPTADAAHGPAFSRVRFPVPLSYPGNEQIV